MSVLGIDPGKNQTWYALLDSTWFRTPDEVRLPHWHLLTSGHLDLSPDLPVQDRMEVIQERLEKLLGDLKPSLVVFERYIVRPGMGRGNVSEIVNLLGGVLWQKCANLDIACELVMPSVHKMWWDRTYIRHPVKRWPNLNDHEGDACSLAIYGHQSRAKTVKAM
jgi:hypothetical protein